MRSKRLVPVIVFVSLFSAGACKNASSAMSPGYCDAVVKVFNYDTGASDDSPAGIRTTYAKAPRDLRAPFATLTAAGPAAARAAVRDLRAAFATSARSGTDTTDRQVRANSALVAAAHKGCRWPLRKMAAADFAFSGVPSALSAGRNAFALKNNAVDSPHLLLLVRVKAGVTKSVDELAGELRASQDTDFDGFAGRVFALPASTAYGLVDVKPGRYLYVCPLPLKENDFGGPDHAMKGMRGELTVT